jgi:hypothetical protein
MRPVVTGSESKAVASVIVFIILVSTHDTSDGAVQTARAPSLNLLRTVASARTQVGKWRLSNEPHRTVTLCDAHSG